MGPLPCSSPSQGQQQTQGRQLSVTILGWWRGQCCAQPETLCESGGDKGDSGPSPYLPQENGGAHSDVSEEEGFAWGLEGFTGRVP